MLEYTLNIVFRIIEISIIIEALLSWVPGVRPNNYYTDILGKITDPFLKVGRKFLGVILPNSSIDLSPIIVLIAIDILRVIARILL